MQLDYSVQDIAAFTAGKIIGSPSQKIEHVVIDSRSPIMPSNSLFIALKGNKLDGHEFCHEFIKKGGKVVLVEKEIAAFNGTQIVVKNALIALQEIAKNHRAKFDLKTIAITGSNGKTTVKEWLYHVLKDKFNIVRSPKSYNSQIGVALSLLEIKPEHTLGIFEAGISMPGEMEKLEEIIQPTIGIYTGIGDAHQSNFSSVDEKVKEKQLLFKSVENLISENEDTIQAIQTELPYKGIASIKNAGLIYQTATYLKLDHTYIIERLIEPPMISMRLEKIEGNNGNTLINDAYNFDEKGLEIGLKNQSINSKGLSKVLIIAPNHAYQPSASFFKLIYASNLDTIVWIHPQKQNFDTTIKNFQFNSIDAFLKSPIEFKDSIILFSGSRSIKLEQIIPFYQAKKHVTKLEIDLSAIRNNINYYRNHLQEKTMILAMVKAQSYGGGLIEIANFLAEEKINYLGVAYADEGVLLRKSGVELPILVMNPEQSAFDDIIDYDLEPSIYSLELLNRFIHQLILKHKTGFPIHLKIDSGMNRLGFQLKDSSELIQTINAQPEIYIQSIFSHLATADNPEEAEFTNQQISLFDKYASQIEAGIGYHPIKHIANSDGTLNYPNAEFDMVRLGIGLFGLNDNPNLIEALSFKTEISQIKIIEKGETVGYGRRFKAHNTTKIGIIPVGYADGFSRLLGNEIWAVKCNDQFAPIIGSVCMDMCMIDISKIDCKTGDAIEIFGWEKSVYDMATKTGTIPYEIISSISSRVHRVYVD